MQEVMLISFVKLAGWAYLSYFIDSMKIKQKIQAVLILVAIGLGIVAPAGLVYAAGNNNCGPDTAIIVCPTDTNNGSSDTSKTAVWSLLVTVIKILTGGVGVVAIAGVVWGAILYTTSAGSPEQVKKALEVFRNVVIGIIAYAVMFAFLNFIIPGGIFG